MVKKRGGSGGLSRRTALLLIGGGGLFAASGSGAFTRVEGGRKFDASSVSDQNALLSIQMFDVSFPTQGDEKLILRLYNRTDSTVDTSVNISSSHSFLSITQSPSSIRTTDGWRNVYAEAVREQQNSAPVEVTITAESASTTIEAVRTLDIEASTQNLPSSCPVSPTVTVSTDDNARGTVENLGSVSNDIDGDVLISNGNDFDITSASTINISGKIAGSSTGNIKIQNDNVGKSIISSPGKNVKVKGISSVGGEIIAGGGITIKGKNQSNQAVVSRNIRAEKIDQIQDAVIGGDVIINGGGEIQRAKIGGEIKTGSGNDVSIKDSTVCGIIRSDGNAKIKQGSQIKGVRTTTGGKNIKIKNGSEVSQNIHLKGSGEVIIKNKSVVKGNITANNGTVTVQGTVEGNITAQKITINGNGTVQGNMTEI